MPTLPRGIRNNNPGNLVHGAPWQGLAADRTDPRFCRFTEPVYGLRALMKVLVSYQRSHGLETVAALIDRWAPEFENDTKAYVAAVAQRLGVAPDAPIQVADRLEDLARAIVRHENGPPPAGWPADWYDDALYRRARALALDLAAG